MLTAVCAVRYCPQTFRAFGTCIRQGKSDYPADWPKKRAPNNTAPDLVVFRTYQPTDDRADDAPEHNVYARVIHAGDFSISSLALSSMKRQVGARATA
jgi:hypothetical protein